jgi:hypothetical protein
MLVHAKVGEKGGGRGRIHLYVKLDVKKQMQQHPKNTLLIQNNMSYSTIIFVR